MDEQTYWDAYAKGSQIAADADAARECALGLQSIAGTAHEAPIITRQHLNGLRNDPGRRGAGWTRSTLAAEIGRLERIEKRQQVYLQCLRAHEQKHQAELGRLANMRQSTRKLLESLTADFEAMIQHNERAKETPKVETVNKELATLRNDIQRRQTELRFMQSGVARIPLALALERANETITHMRGEAQEKIESLLTDLTLTGRSAPITLCSRNNKIDLELILVELLPALGDALKQRVIESYGSDVSGIDPKELPGKIQALENELHALEVQDIAISQKHGESLRPDTSARALLGV